MHPSSESESDSRCDDVGAGQSRRKRRPRMSCEELERLESEGRLVSRLDRGRLYTARTRRRQKEEMKQQLQLMTAMTPLAVSAMPVVRARTATASFLPNSSSYLLVPATVVGTLMQGYQYGQMYEQQLRSIARVATTGLPIGVQPAYEHALEAATAHFGRPIHVAAADMLPQQMDAAPSRPFRASAPTSSSASRPHVRARVIPAQLPTPPVRAAAVAAVGQSSSSSHSTTFATVIPAVTASATPYSESRSRFSHGAANSVSVIARSVEPVQAVPVPVPAPAPARAPAQVPVKPVQAVPVPAQVPTPSPCPTPVFVPASVAPLSLPASPVLATTTAIGASVNWIAHGIPQDDPS